MLRGCAATVSLLDNEAITVLQRWLAARRQRKVAEGQVLFISNIGARITRRSIENLIERHAERVGLHNRSRKVGGSIHASLLPPLVCHSLLRTRMSRDFVKELRGDTRGEDIYIYYHIDMKELRESYLAHIPKQGI